MHARAGGPDGVTLGLFAVLVMVGAGNFLAVRVSNFDLPPFWGAGLRFTLAAALFVALSAVLRLHLPRRQDLPLMVAFGVLNFAAFYALMYWALLYVTAGAASIVLATVPLVTVLLAAAQRLETLRLRGLAGGSLAVAGITLMTVDPGHAALPLGPLLAILGAVLCAGQSFIVGKRLQHVHPATTSAVGMATGGTLLLVLSASVREPWHLPSEQGPTIALVYLVTVGSVGLFLLALTVIRRWTASATSYMFVLFPVATMLLEALLLAEPIRTGAVIGAALVMAGVWFGALTPAGRRRPPAAEAAEPKGAAARTRAVRAAPPASYGS